MSLINKIALCFILIGIIILILPIIYKASIKLKDAMIELYMYGLGLIFNRKATNINNNSLTKVGGSFSEEKALEIFSKVTDIKLIDSMDNLKLSEQSKYMYYKKLGIEWLKNDRTNMHMTFDGYIDPKVFKAKLSEKKIIDSKYVSIAIEYQGPIHWNVNTKEQFISRLQYKRYNNIVTKDNLKVILCERNHVLLISIPPMEDIYQTYIEEKLSFGKITGIKKIDIDDKIITQEEILKDYICSRIYETDLKMLVHGVKYEFLEKINKIAASAKDVQHRINTNIKHNLADIELIELENKEFYESNLTELKKNLKKNYLEFINNKICCELNSIEREMVELKKEKNLQNKSLDKKKKLLIRYPSFIKRTEFKQEQTDKLNTFKQEQTNDLNKFKQTKDNELNEFKQAKDNELNTFKQEQTDELNLFDIKNSENIKDDTYTAKNLVIFEKENREEQDNIFINTTKEIKIINTQIEEIRVKFTNITTRRIYICQRYESLIPLNINNSCCNNLKKIKQL
jgi:hypothetical protein